jgi:threonine/homoserine efflux transporter RhtA
VLAELLNRHFPPAELIAIRFAGSLLLTIAIFGRSMLRHAPQPRSMSEADSHGSALSPMIIAMFAGFALAGAAFTQSYGIYLTGAPVHSAFLSALIAICIPFLQKLFGDALSLRRVLFPVGLSVIGTAMLIKWSVPKLGDVLLIICAVFYALQSTLIGKIKKRIHYAAAHAIACMCCILSAVPFLATIDHKTLICPSTFIEWIGLAALAILFTFVPWNLVHYAQQFKNIDAYQVGLLYTLEPVVTAGIGIPLMYLSSYISVQPLSILGCFLIVAANERMAKLDAS